MESTPELQFAEFQKSLTPQRMKAFQIVAGALLMGATLFLVVILFLYSGSSGGPSARSEAADDSILPMLTVVHIVEAGICYLAAFFVYRFFTSPKGLEFLQKSANKRGDMHANLPIEQRVVGAMFTSFVISAGLLEGVTLFGIIVCLLGTQEGQIQEQPVYWLNLFSYVVFAAFILKAFPTKERLEDVFRRRFEINAHQTARMT